MLFNGALSDEPLSYMVRISNSVSSLTVDALEKTASKGGTVVIRIDGNSLDGVTIKDNGVDIKNQLVSYSGGGDLTYTALAQSYTLSTQLITNASYASRPIGVPAETDLTYTGQMYYSSTSYIEYLFDFSEIPSNASNISLEVKAKGHTGTTSSVSPLRLYSNTTPKSSNTYFASKTDTVKTINVSGYTWTLEDLKNNPKLRLTLGTTSTSGASITGITWKVNYFITPYNYWEYTISNINETHNIVIS